MYYKDAVQKLKTIQLKPKKLSRKYNRASFFVVLGEEDNFKSDFIVDAFQFRFADVAALCFILQLLSVGD